MALIPKVPVADPRSLIPEKLGRIARPVHLLFFTDGSVSKRIFAYKL
jgi:hypothetical protein